jgi:hypothetical protein
VGTPAWAVLALARALTPDPAGHGTHKQLGLGTCSILAATGVPCPVCGMTTSFTHLAHLDPVGAVIAQPFGAVLFAITLAVALLAAIELMIPQGRWTRLWAWILDHERRIAAGLFAGLGVGWIYKVIALG